MLIAPLFLSFQDARIDIDDAYDMLNRGDDGWRSKLGEAEGKTRNAEALVNAAVEKKAEVDSIRAEKLTGIDHHLERLDKVKDRLLFESPSVFLMHPSNEHLIG